MALIHAQFVSQTLARSVTMQVILPVDKFSLMNRPNEEPRPFKTLYLLHGVFGNSGDWVQHTRVQRWAEDRNLAVVMPDGENGYYVDHPDGHHNYSAFIRELVDVTRRMFRLSADRADTFIGGLSMGGYGAIENGLIYHDVFSAICAFSPALLFESTFGLQGMSLDGVPGFERSFFESCFGDLDAAGATDKNPRLLAQNLMREPDVELPSIFITCGTRDRLTVGSARSFAAFLDELGIANTYDEWRGGHNWDFWDESIRRALAWLPRD